MTTVRWVEGHYESDEDETLRERAERAETENERLRAEVETHLSDKEKLREAWKVPVARIDAALAVLNERLRCGEIEADVYVDVVKALKGGK